MESLIAHLPPPRIVEAYDRAAREIGQVEGEVLDDEEFRDAMMRHLTDVGVEYALEILAKRGIISVRTEAGQELWSIRKARRIMVAAA